MTFENRAQCITKAALAVDSSGGGTGAVCNQPVTTRQRQH
jgi:hypothetical protein